MTLALVTGGGGFLGRFIIEKLLAEKIAVRSFSRGKYPELKQLGCEIIQGDLRNQSALNQACHGVDIVFHVAALAGVWGKRQDFFSINVEGTRNLIQACEQEKVSRLVYTSSPSVVFAMSDLEGANETLPYPQKFYAHYPESKAIAEKLVLEANAKNSLATCSLRPHLIWGPRDTHIIPMLINRTREGKLVQIGQGKNKVDVSYVENSADAHVQAALKLKPDSPVAGQAYFIGDDFPVNLWEWVNALLTLLQLPGVKRKIPYRSAYILGYFMENLYTLFPKLGEPRVTRFLACQFAKSHYFDHGKAKRDFGYHPKISNEEGLKRTVDWFTKH